MAALRTAFRDERKTCERAAKRLGRIRSVEAVALLESALRDVDADVRERAARALAAMR